VDDHARAHAHDRLHDQDRQRHDAGRQRRRALGRLEVEWEVIVPAEKDLGKPAPVS
jgi:hypothetical protein